MTGRLSACRRTPAGRPALITVAGIAGSDRQPMVDSDGRWAASRRPRADETHTKLLLQRWFRRAQAASCFAPPTDAHAALRHAPCRAELFRYATSTQRAADNELAGGCATALKLRTASARTKNTSQFRQVVLAPECALPASRCLGSRYAIYRLARRRSGCSFSDARSRRDTPSGVCSLSTPATATAHH